MNDMKRKRKKEKVKEKTNPMMDFPNPFTRPCVALHQSSTLLKLNLH